MRLWSYEGREERNEAAEITRGKNGDAYRNSVSVALSYAVKIFFLISS